MRGLLLSLLVLLPGCASPPEVRYVTRTVQVEVPVYTRATPPPELMEQYKPQLPVFVYPDDPKAKAALTSEGIDALWMMINDLVDRNRAWRAWATP